MGRSAESPSRAARPMAMLSPGLLVRKGGARPAMRSQMALTVDPDLAAEEAALEDLGWNDMGEVPERALGRVVDFPLEARAPAAEPAKARRRPRGTALRYGRKAAFTLRLDAERHSRLHAACAREARSAQLLLTEALDRLLAELPDTPPAEAAPPAPRRGRP